MWVGPGINQYSLVKGIEMKYTVVDTDNVDDLIARVNKMLRLGWTIKGAVVVIQAAGSYRASHYFRYSQTMIKESDEPDGT